MGTETTAVLDSPIRICQLRKALRGNSQIELVGPVDRAFIRMACTRHEWNWPILNRDIAKIDGFDAHQSCTKCASQRLFNSRNWIPGPMFRKLSHCSRWKGRVSWQQCNSRRHSYRNSLGTLSDFRAFGSKHGMPQCWSRRSSHRVFSLESWSQRGLLLSCPTEIARNRSRQVQGRLRSTRRNIPRLYSQTAPVAGSYLFGARRYMPNSGPAGCASHVPYL